MGLWERAEETDRKLRETELLYRIKHTLDKLLVLALVLIGVVLYLEFIAPSSHILYPYKNALQVTVLLYFVLELLVDFIIYEERTQFFKDRWLDILLTLPFLTAFKGVNGLLRGLTGAKALKTAKVGKAAKTGKTAKAGKLGKGVKLTQKTGKLVTKGKKLLKKHFA